MPFLYGVEVDKGALCPVAKLHGLDPIEDITSHGSYITGAIIEVCRYCGEKKVYKKVRGRIDNRTHVAEHIRDTVQPQGRTKELFEWLFGKVINNRGATERQDE